MARRSADEKGDSLPDRGAPRAPERPVAPIARETSGAMPEARRTTVQEFLSTPFVGIFPLVFCAGNRAASKNRRTSPEIFLIHQGRAFPLMCGTRAEADSAILAIAKKIKKLTPTM
ncbi:hypothetical protein ACFPU0_05525 [Pseudomonas sp. GCM10022186]|uniref:hypothetical protein n=1 Tax=Pseudomonas sp. GCM10022186 TaxID=3252650 RepID=UPI003621B85F